LVGGRERFEREERLGFDFWEFRIFFYREGEGENFSSQIKRKGRKILHKDPSTPGYCKHYSLPLLPLVQG